VGANSNFFPSPGHADEAGVATKLNPSIKRMIRAGFKQRLIDWPLYRFTVIISK
jgi:hypothetical protein